MVLGSRPFKDLSMGEGDPGWETTLHAVYEELMALKGGAQPSLAQRPPPPPPPPPPPKRRENSGGLRAPAAASSSSAVLEMTMAQKVPAAPAACCLLPAACCLLPAAC